MLGITTQCDQYIQGGLPVNLGGFSRSSPGAETNSGADSGQALPKRVGLSDSR
jgi:hypothetical protein